VLSHEVNELILAFANNHDEGGGPPRSRSLISSV